MKPFNGYIKVKDETPGVYWLKKIENGCHVTIHEIFNSKNELLYRGKYPYDKANNQILSYDLDSVNLGKSELWDKELTDTLQLTKLRIMNYYNSDYSNNTEKVTPIDGVIYRNDNGEIYSIHYKNGTAVNLITYYDNKEFDSSGKNIPELKKKTSHQLLFNENGNIYDSRLSDKKYPFIFTGEYIRWDKKGKVISTKNIRNKLHKKWMN